MPKLSVYLTRSALMCLVIGFTLGTVLMAAKIGLITPRFWAWLPAHIVLLLFGWLIQFAVGVAYWILPRIEVADRGRPRWAWSSFIAFQIGITLTLLSLTGVWRVEWGRLISPGVIAQLAAVILFAIHARPRLAQPITPVSPESLARR